MEIDLTELELYEKQLNEKRKQRAKLNETPANTANDVDTTTVDEIDEYLDQLALELRAKNDETVSTSQHKNDSIKKSDLPTGSKSCSVPNQSSHIDTEKNVANDASNKNTDTQISSQTSFPLLLFGFLSILAFVNSVRCKNVFNKLFFVFLQYNITSIKLLSKQKHIHNYLTHSCMFSFFYLFVC